MSEIKDREDRNQEEDNVNHTMNRTNVGNLLAAAVLLLGVLSWVLVLHWQFGLATAAGAIVLGFVHNWKFQSSPAVTAGMVIALFYLITVLVFLLFLRMYLGGLGIHL